MFNSNNNQFLTFNTLTVSCQWYGRQSDRYGHAIRFTDDAVKDYLQSKITEWSDRQNFQDVTIRINNRWLYLNFWMVSPVERPDNSHLTKELSSLVASVLAEKYPRLRSGSTRELRAKNYRNGRIVLP